MTVSAPATSAFAMSPEYCSPPSAITGMPASRAARDASYTAVTWGTPTPATMRVVQIEPGPTPTLTASTPASMSACAPSRVATLPPMMSMWSNDESAFRRRTMSITPADWPLAVSTTRTSTPASRSASARSHASPKKPIAAPTRRRPCSSLVASGYFSLLSKSLMVMRPASLPSSSMSGSFSMRCFAKSRDDLVGADADGSGDEALGGHDVAHERRLTLEARDEPHVAVGDDADQAAVFIDDRQARDAVLSRTGCRPLRSWRRAWS